MKCFLETIGQAIIGALHSLTALGRLLNSLGPIDVKKVYLRVLILLLRAIRFGTMHWGPVLSWVTIFPGRLLRVVSRILSWHI